MLKVFLTDLAAYNHGCLHGKWNTLPMDEVDLQKELFDILKDGEKLIHGYNHEEYFII